MSNQNCGPFSLSLRKAQEILTERERQKAEWKKKFAENHVAQMLKNAAEEKGHFEFAWGTYECPDWEEEFYVNMADLAWEVIGQSPERKQ